MAPCESVEVYWPVVDLQSQGFDSSPSRIERLRVFRTRTEYLADVFDIVVRREESANGDDDILID